MPDGRVINHPKAKYTFIEVMKTVGVNKVSSLGLKFCKIPIVSNTRDSKYGKAQHSIGGGWLVVTHSSTKDKKKMLDKIAKALQLNIKVKII